MTPSCKWPIGYMNRPFPNSKKSRFQSEAKCEAIDMEMIVNYNVNKTHFHNKSFALSIVLKVRYFGTRKWPIEICENVVLSKNRYFYDNNKQKTLKLIKAAFCVIWTSY